MKSSLPLILLAFLISGCTSYRKNLGGPVPDAAVVGQVGAPVGEILATCGPPSKVSALGDGMVFFYERASVSEKQLGISIDYQWFRFFKFAIGRASANREATALVFDGDGLLLASGNRKWIDDLGGGSSLQLIVTVMSVVDTGKIGDSPAELEWGASLLESRLPVALNQQYSPASGDNGLEQIGTPSGAGQRTLEMGTFPLINL